MVIAHNTARNHPPANHPPAQDHPALSQSHTNVNPDDHRSSECSYSIETSPNICLISIRFGDGVEIFVNGDCTVINFLQYTAERMNQNGLAISPEEYPLLDLVDEEGTVQGIRKLPPQDHMSNCLHHRMLYIPVKLEQRPESTTTTTAPVAPAKDPEDEDWQILLVPHDAYFSYIEEAMLSIKEAKHMEQLPMSAKSPHGDTASIKSRGSANPHHPPKFPGKKGKK